MEPSSADQTAAPVSAEHAPAAPASAELPAAKLSVEQRIDEWFREHFSGLAGSLHDHVFNHVNAAKEELKKVLRELA